MFRQWPNLVVLGVVGVLLCSTPILRGRTPTAPVLLDQHQHGSEGHEHVQHVHIAAQAMPMAMVFEYGYRTTLWFSALQTDTVASYIAVLLGLGLMAFVHEGITAYRRTRAIAAHSFSDEIEAKGVYPTASSGQAERLVQAGLHVLSISLSYLLMLAIMSMNFGVLLAVLTGFGTGFYAFSGADSAAVAAALPPVVRGDACHGS